MKKILIVIHDMAIGGAQKSLLSFLQCLEGYAQREQYEVHLLPLNPEGEFLAQLPKDVVVEQPANAVCWMSRGISRQLLTKWFSLRGVLGEVMWVLRKTGKRFQQGTNAAQKLWYNWQRFLPSLKQEYDIAIAYMDGTPSYYVMDKVQAKKKVLWLHSDYQKQQYLPVFDAPYYAGCDKIVTVSEECLNTLRRAHPGQAEKMHVLENISSSALVARQSQMGPCPEFAGAEGLKLVTVARLNPQKGIDLAIEAARCLKESGLNFLWLTVGEGSERAGLEALIARYGLEKHFKLIGMRQNPYIYMRECDILVQPSRIEGKSIVLDEAKMLEKPIVVTSYPTVRDSIEHGVTGWVTEMSGEGLAAGILHVQGDEALRTALVCQLADMPKGNENLIEQYAQVMF